jgi:hypothetical protein
MRAAKSAEAGANRPDRIRSHRNSESGFTTECWGRIKQTDGETNRRISTTELAEIAEILTLCQWSDFDELPSGLPSALRLSLRLRLEESLRVEDSRVVVSCQFSLVSGQWSVVRVAA